MNSPNANRRARRDFATTFTIALGLLLLSCHTKKTVTEESMTLQEWVQMNLDTHDTLYLPWQLWSPDTAPPLPIIHNRSATATAHHQVDQRDTTTKTTSFQNNNSSTHFTTSWFLGNVIVLILGLTFLVFFVAVMRRL